LLDGTLNGNRLVSTLRPRLTFVILDTTPRKFKKATAAQVADAAKKELAMPIKAKDDQVRTSLRNNNKEHVSSHIIDSRPMLPSSYGTGKRR
jgi:Iap family predicted aminopeptidase